MQRPPSHDLILRHNTRLFLAFHSFGAVGSLVLDVSQAKGTAAVLIASKLG